MRISDWSSDVCSSDLPAMLRIGKPQSIEHVSSHSLMREQAPILKNIASTPPPGGHIDSVAAVKQHIFTHGYAPFIRAQQTGNPVQQAGLARPRRPEGRRVGKECVITLSSRWSLAHLHKITSNAEPKRYSHE